MSARRALCLSDGALDLPQLPRDAAGPVFAEPWHAQAFALAVTLSQQGHFTSTEWAHTLGAELAAAAARGEPDDGSRYYEHWLAALERLTAQKGLAPPLAMQARKAAWVDAYRTTPHGRPVELRATPRTWLRGWAAGGACTAVAFWALQSGSGNAPHEATSPALGHVAGLGSTGVTLGLAASAGLGTLLGMRHALEPDHLAAVSTLMTGERTSARAALLGACWGIGHTLTLLATGLLLALLRTEMPSVASRFFELAVVVTLVGFGVRAMSLGVGGALGPTHTHGRPASGRGTPLRWSLTRPLMVGALHGLAGSGALMALVAATLPSPAAQLTYLTLFGLGSILGMAVLSGLLGWPLARLGTHHVVTRTFSLVAGSVSVALGLSWGLTAIRGGF
nr:hypothetical protein FLJDLJJJ_00025 [uncultured bacterium]